MSVFSIKPRPDGLIVVAASPSDPAAPYQLAGTDAEIDSTLPVLAQTGIEVVQHNASHETMSNTVNCFQWRIETPYDNPRIILRPPELSGRVDIFRA